LQDEPERRTRLKELFTFAHGRLLPDAKLGELTQIIPVILGEDHKAMAAAAYLQSKGFDVRGIRPPTVPAGTARLRVSITLNVSQEDVANLADALADFAA
jgi:8-amino-7-oxononanoate synthase